MEVPIFLSDKVEHVAVEVQFRTIAMDFWASLEHKLRYKKNLSEEKEKEIERRLILEVYLIDVNYFSTLCFIE